MVMLVSFNADLFPDDPNHRRRMRAAARVVHYSKRPASLWVEDEAVPLGGVVTVVLAESPDQLARDDDVVYAAGDLVTAHQRASGA
jgi:hypothetical protein